MKRFLILSLLWGFLFDACAQRAEPKEEKKAEAAQKGLRALQHGVPPAFPDGSLDWMVGQWKVIEKLRRGKAHPSLESVVLLSVFPYADYAHARLSDGLFMAAEFQCADANWEISAPDIFYPLLLYSDRMIVSRFAWNLHCSALKAGPTNSLTLVFQDDVGCVKLRFDKISEDPKEPMNWNAVLMNACVSREDAEEAAARFREHRASNSRPAPNGSSSWVTNCVEDPISK